MENREPKICPERTPHPKVRLLNIALAFFSPATIPIYIIYKGGGFCHPFSFPCSSCFSCFSNLSHSPQLP